MKIITNAPDMYFTLLQGMEGEEIELGARGFHGRPTMIMGVEIDGLKLRGSVRVLWQDIEWIKFLRGLTREARRSERS